MGESAESPIRGLYAVIDSTYVAAPEMPRLCSELTRSGVGLVQLRAKGLVAGEMLGVARDLRRVCAASGALLIVNDRLDVALASGAHGVHLGQSDVPAAEARRLMGGDALIGVSTHDPDEAEQAARARADYVSFGPVFATRTKPDAESPRGLEALSIVCAASRLPVVAIGGITTENLGAVLKAGASAAAVISDLLCAPDVAARAAQLVSITAEAGKWRG